MFGIRGIALLAGLAGAARPQATVPAGVRSSVLLDQVRAIARVVENLATTEIEQVFRNVGSVPAEEDYLFPLPDEAVASSLSLTIDGKVVKGELLDRDRARRGRRGGESSRLPARAARRRSPRAGNRSRSRSASSRGSLRATGTSSAG